AMGSTALSLRWTEIYRHYYDENYIEVSNDNGVTWTQFAVNPVSEVPVNTSSTDPELDEINITTAMTGGVWGTQVKIRLYYKGQWDWFWGVDDLAIIETAANDLHVRTVKDRYTGKKIQYSQIPMAQLAAMDFDAVVDNNGGADQTTSQLDVVVSGAGTFSGSSVSTNIAASASAKLTVSGFTPSALGTYNVSYNVYDPATTDYSPADNVGFATFDVSNYTYAKDTNGLDGWYGPFDDDEDGVDDPMEFIAEYEFNATETIYGISLVVMGGGATAQTPVGQEIYYNIYSDDGAGNFIPEYDGLTIPVPTYIITAADLTASSGSEVWLGLQLPSPVVADPAVSAFYYPVVGYTIDSVFLALSSDAADTTNFLTVFATTDGQSDYFISSVPMFRLSTDPAFPPSGPSGITEEVANVALGQNMPNPFNTNTVVPFSLVNAANVSFTVVDITGKIIENRELGTLSSGDHTINFDGSSLSSGIYYYSVIVDGKNSTKKFSVAK
ncbi:MAG: T9SS type A sorting domain-containing protein, partial [Flavobacteriales bacterium]|nr:T9SS type A sorting domain-containing protein [Flavobacteriales bacterium]